MCGFTGFLDREPRRDALRRMTHALRHRGPDSDGVWCDDANGVALGHARLAILDLSSAGHQPMVSRSGRFVLTYNGEVYNHLDIRAELERGGGAPSWRGHADTETLLAGFEVWGIRPTLTRSVGMFGLAVWDRESREVTLARDRIGEKPVYYGWQNGAFLFGSELKALKAHPAFQGDIDRSALTLLMRHGYIPAPYSIYAGVHKQVPGTLVTVSLDRRELRTSRYWDPFQVVADGAGRPFQGSPGEAVEEMERLLSNAIGLQMVADVPLGAFLSGGIDSSTIVALMQAQSSRPIRTFTIGFEEAGYNEAEHAKAVAQHLGTEHSELYLSSKQTLDVIPSLPELYCEPFADSSQVPTFLVSRMARGNVKVSLSGDGGDELFAGYSRYLLGRQIWNKMKWIPSPIRKSVARSVACVPAEEWNRLLRRLQTLLAPQFAQVNLGDKIIKAAAVVGARDATQLYRLLVSQWEDPGELVVGGTEPATILEDSRASRLTDTFVEQMMALDLVTYLPDDILVKVDRAAMGVSLETRVPFLDHRVVEFAWSLPLRHKLRGGTSKWLLRQVLYRHVPRKLVERPKMGFGIPIDTWLRGPLRHWAEDLLDESRLSREGYLNPRLVRVRWKEHLEGTRNWQYHLWTVLMFQAWLSASKSADSASNDALSVNSLAPFH